LIADQPGQFGASFRDRHANQLHARRYARKCSRDCDAFVSLPESAVWALGLLAGIRLLFSGWSFIYLALSGKRASEEGGAAAA
jgi:hypothetical protein